MIAYVYCLLVLFVLFLLARRIVNSPFGLSLRAVKGNPLRASAIGISVNAAAGRDLHGRRRLCGHRRRAADPDDAVRLARRVLASSARPTCCLILIIGGTGYLYGGLIGAVLFKLMQD